MKLFDIINAQANQPEVAKLHSLGQALVKPTEVVNVREAKKVVKKPRVSEDDMTEAALELTAGNKSVHHKIKHHD